MSLILTTIIPTAPGARRAARIFRSLCSIFLILVTVLAFPISDSHAARAKNKRPATLKKLSIDEQRYAEHVIEGITEELEPTFQAVLRELQNKLSTANAQETLLLHRKEAFVRDEQAKLKANLIEKYVYTDWLTPDEGKKELGKLASEIARRQKEFDELAVSKMASPLYAEKENIPALQLEITAQIQDLFLTVFTQSAKIYSDGHTHQRFYKGYTTFYERMKRSKYTLSPSLLIWSTIFTLETCSGKSLTTGATLDALLAAYVIFPVLYVSIQALAKAGSSTKSLNELFDQIDAAQNDALDRLRIEGLASPDSTLEDQLSKAVQQFLSLPLDCVGLLETNKVPRLTNTQ